jgi:hypothetical protein
VDDRDGRTVHVEGKPRDGALGVEARAARGQQRKRLWRSEDRLYPEPRRQNRPLQGAQGRLVAGRIIGKAPGHNPRVPRETLAAAHAPQRLDEGHVERRPRPRLDHVQRHDLRDPGAGRTYTHEDARLPTELDTGDAGHGWLWIFRPLRANTLQR